MYITQFLKKGKIAGIPSTEATTLSFSCSGIPHILATLTHRSIPFFPFIFLNTWPAKPRWPNERPKKMTKKKKLIQSPTQRTGIMPKKTDLCFIRKKIIKFEDVFGKPTWLWYERRKKDTKVNFAEALILLELQSYYHQSNVFALNEL